MPLNNCKTVLKLQNIPFHSQITCVFTQRFISLQQMSVGECF